MTLVLKSVPGAITLDSTDVNYLLITSLSALYYLALPSSFVGKSVVVNLVRCLNFYQTFELTVMKRSQVSLFVFLSSSIILVFTTVGLNMHFGLRFAVGYDKGYFLPRSRHILHKTSRFMSDATREVFELSQEGCLWSESLESQEPSMFDEEHTGVWRAKTQVQQIVHLEPGCGRVTNGLATFADGSKACVRYGIDADQVQGEILSYYLARMLGIYNLPPAVLSKPDPERKQWMLVRKNRLFALDHASYRFTD